MWEFSSTQPFRTKRNGIKNYLDWEKSFVLFLITVVIYSIYIIRINYNSHKAWPKMIFKLEMQVIAKERRLRL